MTQILVNGEQRHIEEGCSLAQLLNELDVADQRLAIEVNRTLVSHKSYAQTVLHAGDAVEIVTFVGGG